MSYGAAQPDDFEPLVDLLVEAYHCDRRLTAEGLQRRGLDSFRLLRAEGRLEAALELIVVGQWFGGRRVSCAAVAWVATRVAARGSGIATELMRAALQEARARGVALSALFPSNESLYRKLGYERAGHLVRYDLPLAALRRTRRDGRIERLDRPDAPEILEVYQACARRDAGLLDRDHSFWSDRFDPLPDAALAAYLVRNDGRPEGYVLLDQRPHGTQIVLRDVMFTTRRAGEQILTLLAGHNGLFETVRWWGGVQDPLAHLLPDQLAMAAPQRPWMLRIVDPGAALSQRGYAAPLRGTLHLELSDPLFADNAGPWQLELEAGRAAAARGGQARLRLDVGALAALYSGHMTPSLLALLDRLAGPPEDQALAALAFAGPPPYVCDVF